MANQFEDQTNSLRAEFNALREKLFAGHSFVQREKTQDWDRYDQLFAFFNPQFRTKNFTSPITSDWQQSTNNP